MLTQITKGLDNFLTRQFFIVTGLSGAGKTVLIRSLEDFGFYCVDNLPLPLLPTFLGLINQSQPSMMKIALGIDIRGERFLTDFIREVEKIKLEHRGGWSFEVIFLQANENTLVRRYQATRRKHPLSDEKLELKDAIKREKKVLAPLKKIANTVLSTDAFNVHELRQWAKQSLSSGVRHEVLVNLVSFGFKYGVPAESNLVYDLRFLPNPYFEPKLKMFDGRQEVIQSYLFKKEVVLDYWLRLKDFLQYSIEKFYQEGRFFVNISIGCTGGKHRSVAFVERLQRETWENSKFIVHHRDLGKE